MIKFCVPFLAMLCWQGFAIDDALYDWQPVRLGAWTRVSFYPTGIFDQPTCLAASWDEFGKVVVGFGGNSYVVGRP